MRGRFGGVLAGKQGQRALPDGFAVVFGLCPFFHVAADAVGVPVAEDEQAQAMQEGRHGAQRFARTFRYRGQVAGDVGQFDGIDVELDAGMFSVFVCHRFFRVLEMLTL